MKKEQNMGYLKTLSCGLTYILQEFQYRREVWEEGFLVEIVAKNFPDQVNMNINIPNFKLQVR